MEEILNTELVVVEEEDGVINVPEVFDPIECDDVSEGDVEGEPTELVDTMPITPIDCNICE